MQISSQTVVLIDYTLKSNSGEILDSTVGAEPMPYLHGVGMIVPGLETALAGKTTGDRLEVSIEPKDAFGERREELQQEVDRVEFADIEDLEIGMQFRVPDHEDEEIIITVVGMTAEKVTVDGNHALAGQTLNFDITVRDVREATEEEIAHGHPHGVGGCSH